MRLYPQRGFCRASCPASARTSSGAGGRLLQEQKRARSCYTGVHVVISVPAVGYTEAVDKNSEGDYMALEENGFLEYLQLQGSDPELVTKSELISAVRQRGYSVGDRQLTFYISEGLVPKSVRVGSRAGAC